MEVVGLAFCRSSVLSRRSARLFSRSFNLSCLFVKRSDKENPSVYQSAFFQSIWLLGVGLSGGRSATLSIWGFPKIRGTLLGVSTTRVIVLWGLY